MNPIHCLWPECPKQVEPHRAFCYRHFHHLPERLRRWVGVKFDRSQLKVKGSDTQRAVGACRSWAKRHPDSELPPFRHGDHVQGKPGEIFSGLAYIVDTVVLTDQRTWVVITSDGEQIAARDLIPIPSEVSKTAEP